MRLSCHVSLYAPALISDCSTPPNYCRAEGIIKNCNTIEDYKNLDRAAILDRCAQTVRPPTPLHSRVMFPCRGCAD